jgi:hypothetical protein
MFYKCSVAVVVLAMCAGSLVADDKEKKEAIKQAIKGSVSKFDQAKHSLTLKTDAGEKDYSIAEDVVIVFATGQKVSAAQKAAAPNAAKAARGRGGPQVLAFVLKTGNKVELVLAEKENTVKEIHYDNTAPQGKPAGAPDGTKKYAPKPAVDGTKKDAPDGAKKDAPKKDDGKIDFSGRPVLWAGRLSFLVC